MVIRAALLLAVLAMLSACGVDGPPVRPDPPPGVSMSGEAVIGVIGTL